MSIKMTVFTCLALSLRGATIIGGGEGHSEILIHQIAGEDISRG